MKRPLNTAYLWLWLLAGINLFAISNVSADTEILIIRHGEKPEQGLGQLSCKGFNRALALPGVIARFGKPDAIVAPNPGVQKNDKGVPYSYVRPLATVEPLAISLAMPVEATLAFNNLSGLKRRIEKGMTDTAQHIILIAWEHKIAEQVVRDFLKQNAVSAEVPHWDDEDFDSIYIISQKEKEPIKFRVEKQGLDNLSDKCSK